MRRIDVAVVGADPAGAVAALVLARAGASVQLVDRAAFPRSKLCGDTLNSGAVKALNRLGLASRARKHGRRIDGMILTGLYGITVTGRYSQSGSGAEAWAISRRHLDEALVAAAVDAGVQFDQRVSVRGPLLEEGTHGPRVGGVLVRGRSGRSLRIPASVTIGADGRRSVVATSLGLVRSAPAPRRWVVGGYFENAGSGSQFGEMHVRRNHYIGVAPVPGGLVNVCVVSNRRVLFAQPTALLIRMIAGEPFLRERFSGARLVGPVVSLGPMGVDATSAGAPGLLLAGDAAGFIDPITGDGVRFALRGGELAGQAALEMLATGRIDGHRRLARRRASEFGGKFRFNRAVRTLVGSPLGVAAGSLGAAVLPAALQRLITYAGDVATA